MINLKKRQSKNNRSRLRGACCFLLLVCHTVLFAQNIDSLEKVYLGLPSIKEKDIFDTVRFQILSRLAESSENGKWQKYTLELSRLASTRLKYSEHNDRLIKFYKGCYAHSLNNIGYAYTDSSNYKIAENYFNKSLDIFRELNDQSGLSSVYLNLGSVIRIEGRIQEALMYYEKSLQISEKLNDREGVAVVYNNMAVIFENQGHYLKALENLHQAALTHEEIGQKVPAAITIGNIAHIYELLGDTVNNLKYYNRCLEIYMSEHDQLGVARTYYQLGMLFHKRKESKTAMEYLAKSLEIFTQHKSKFDLSRVDYGIGAVYKQQNNIEEAIKYVGLGLKLAIEINHKKEMARGYQLLASYFLDEKNYLVALDNANKSLQISRELGFPEEIGKAAQILKEVYEHNNDHSKALEMYDLYVKMKDSVNNERVRNESLRKQFQFEYDNQQLIRKEEQKKRAAIEEQKKKYYTMVGVGVTLFIIILIVFIYARSRFNQLKEKRDLMVQVKDSEIKALQAQMNPYFIFNALNSVLEFISKSERAEALKYLTKFSKLIRKMLETSNSKTTLLSSEIELIDLYVEMENLRFGNKFEFRFELEDAIETDNIQIPSLIIQPYVERAVLDGIYYRQKVAEDKKQDYIGKLKLAINKEENYLKCIVEDNGIGRQLAGKIRSKGFFDKEQFGAQATQNRSELLEQNHCKIHVTDLYDDQGNPRGTRVELQMPFEYVF
jgi:tetratricopeptide (TPR) repeat protein